ncbi:MAG: DUF2605 domain-containing protein [Crocosphaera sp.]|nr:DUF2605 domain-containing protein [Crocosphaera sp.]
MSHSNPTEQELLKTVLEPLLEDFQYWFSRARHLLETERITFLSVEEQTNLLERVKTNQQEVQTAKILFQLTGKQAGIDTRALVPWHKLVAECWQVSMKWRSHQQENSPTA